MQTLETKIWDVIVIGGGPAGMMAAATAGSKGTRVLLLEKNNLLGKKLRITGGGRCNVTNNKPETREMLSMYKDRGKFLFSTFSQHGVLESVSWFKERGVELKEENEGRLFPTTDSAETICHTLITEVEKNNVVVLTGQAVRQIQHEEGVFHVTTTEATYNARSCVIAAGGTSRPDTGSTGDGFLWVKTLGHTVNKHNVALVPLVVKEGWVKNISGVSLSDVKLSLLVDNKKVFSEKGKVLFTHTGLSGPTILNMSKRIGELLEAGNVTITINVLAESDEGTIRNKLTTLFHDESNKKIQNALSNILPASLVKQILLIAEIDPDTPCHSVRVTEKKELSALLFALPLTVTGLLGEDKAIISAGGISLSEIDFRTMESKLMPKLFIVGDMLDIDRPSGGYSLQLCWSTGYVAGIHAAQ